jgi:hypothetical protein
MPSGYRVLDSNGIILAHVYGQPSSSQGFPSSSSLKEISQEGQEPTKAAATGSIMALVSDPKEDRALVFAGRVLKQWRLLQPKLAPSMGFCSRAMG